MRVCAAVLLCVCGRTHGSTCARRTDLRVLRVPTHMQAEAFTARREPLPCIVLDFVGHPSDMASPATLSQQTLLGDNV